VREAAAVTREGVLRSLPKPDGRRVDTTLFSPPPGSDADAAPAPAYRAGPPRPETSIVSSAGPAPGGLPNCGPIAKFTA
jgi:hypothetical protein